MNPLFFELQGHPLNESRFTFAIEVLLNYDENKNIFAKYTVNPPADYPWNCDPRFSNSYWQGPKHNWGLWESDVFELFLQRRTRLDESSAPYLELQVSPLNQQFALLIQEPRKRFFVPEHLPYQTRVARSERSPLVATMEVSLESTLPAGDLYFGAFACLGPPGAPRTYYGKSWPDDRLDFHRPQFFCPIKDCPG